MPITIDIMQQRNTNSPPEGIIITVSAGMIGDHGYRHWLRNFLESMKKSEFDPHWHYWFRTSNKPKSDSTINYVYLCIGGKIRYRCFYGGAMGEKTMTFSDGKTIHGKAWIMTSGPIERAPYVIKKQGFQGFRYTEKIF